LIAACLSAGVIPAKLSSVTPLPLNPSPSVLASPVSVTVAVEDTEAVVVRVLEEVVSEVECSGTGARLSPRKIFLSWAFHRGRREVM
jgi:hypothetical protein